MNKAVEFAKEILRKEKAVQKSESNKLKRDYNKGIASEKEELEFYCKCKKISISEVYEMAST